MMCNWCFFKIKFWQNRTTLKTGIVHKECSREINKQAKKMFETIVTPIIKNYVEDFVKTEVMKCKE